MKAVSLEQELSGNSYPGRGILIGRSKDGAYAIAAYFIMGRSINSRNRVFVEDGEGIRTQAYDPAKLTDPSLVIYAPVRVLGDKTIVTNGDQTDTIYERMGGGQTFERISAVMDVHGGSYCFAMSILKSDCGIEGHCCRYTFDYENPKAGEARFIHTYQEDGGPLPSFEGEPVIVEIDGTIDELTERIWNNLNEENKVSLFVRYIKIADGSYESRIVNKNQ